MFKFKHQKEKSVQDFEKMNFWKMIQKEMFLKRQIKKFNSISCQQNILTKRKRYFKQKQKSDRKKSIDIIQRKKNFNLNIEEKEKNFTGYIVKDIMNENVNHVTHLRMFCQLYKQFLDGNLKQFSFKSIDDLSLLKFNRNKKIYLQKTLFQEFFTNFYFHYLKETGNFLVNPSYFIRLPILYIHDPVIGKYASKNKICQTLLTKSRTLETIYLKEQNEQFANAVQNFLLFRNFSKIEYQPSKGLSKQIEKEKKSLNIKKKKKKRYEKLQKFIKFKAIQLKIFNSKKSDHINFFKEIYKNQKNQKAKSTQKTYILPRGGNTIRDQDYLNVDPNSPQFKPLKKDYINIKEVYKVPSQKNFMRSLGIETKTAVSNRNFNIKTHSPKSFRFVKKVKKQNIFINNILNQI